ncbi:hypothetical protein J6590_054169 [Homalodisca vitripennis]|nr:hypothetical protein J6590_054169 [Homalodisca vitripennis]
MNTMLITNGSTRKQHLKTLLKKYVLPRKTSYSLAEDALQPPLLFSNLTNDVEPITIKSRRSPEEDSKFIKMRLKDCSLKEIY